MLLYFIILYILLTLLIGWYASRKVNTSIDFTIAGRRLPVYIVASGLFATWFGSETVLGASSEFMDHGLLGIIEDPFGAALCLFLTGMFFAKPLYKLNILTFSDYFGMRYNKNAEWVSAIFMIPSYFSWIAAQLVAMAIVLQAISPISFGWAVLLCAGIVVFYTYLGGMWSVAITDTIQTVMIIVGLLILMLVLLNKVGGFSNLISQAPDDYFRFIPRQSNLHAWVVYFVAWITVGLGSIPQQDIFQRILSSKNEKTAVWAPIISSVMYLSVAFIPIVIGFCGKILYNDLGTDAQMAIPNLVLMHSTPALQILFFGALLSAILSTCSGAILAPSTVVGENLIKPILELNGKTLEDKSLLRIMRLSVIGIAVISAWLATLSSNIYELVGTSSAISLVGLFLPLCFGLYWKKTNSAGAITSMVSGTIAWLICVLAHTHYPPIVYGLLTGLITIVSCSLMFPKPEKHDFEKINLKANHTD